jgi:AraC family transcriptional activator FtrA
LVLPPHREGGQAQFVERPVAEIEDSLLAKVIEWMRAHARDELKIEDLADKAAMSPRTFFRKFKKATGLAPHDWLVRERVAIARDLLEIHDIPIERVATEAGFNAVETLRYHFRRHVRKSPGDYRRMYEPRPEPDTMVEGVES